MENVQAILLATGETDKLQPLTATVPSPMLPITDRPVMLYAIELLARQGFKEMAVSLYHLAGDVEAYLGNGQRWGVTLNYLLQRDAWGSAGALKWAQPALNQTFVVMPADVLVDVDLEAALAQHRQRQSKATVVVHHFATDGAPGVCPDENGRIQSTVTNGSHPTVYPTGVYIFEPEILNYIPARRQFGILEQLVPALLEAGIAVDTYQMSGYWNRLATFQDYHAAQRHVLYSAWGHAEGLEGLPALNFPSLEGRQIAQGIWVGRNHMIHPSVRLSPPIFIGQNCQIGSDVELGPEVVVGSNVVIDEEATISRSTILDHTYVGQLVNIDGRFVNKNLIVDKVTAESTRVVDQFLLGQVNSLVDNRFQRLWDVSFSLLLLLLTLVVTVPVSLLLLLTNGRIFERVERVGGWPDALLAGSVMDLQRFALWRFCVRKKDGRTTRLGRFLKNWEIYRLPELWNVLKGDLRLVGVKPLTEEDVRQISDVWQQKRHESSPGFTGLWYIQTRPDSSLDEILIADAYYVATRNWREDLKLLSQTPAAWWRRLRRSSIPMPV
ncbi:MAG: sugar transferase [Anaerolineales bacterium]|nr:sugar transferase [Anaerolineales bacterium]